MRRASLLVLAALLPACGGPEPAAPDAGSGQNSLLVLSPPGDSLGLTFGGTATLRVRYVDPSARAIDNAEISFTLVATAAESTGGATLSETSAASDALGIARVELRAGSERSNFRVRAEAPGAAPVLFYVAVSEVGFARIEVTPSHQGFRPDPLTSAVELRLYRPDELRCAELDPDLPADSLFPPRTLPGFAGAAVFSNMSADESYTVAAWALADGAERPLAVGCTELDASAVKASQTVALALPVADRIPAVPAELDLSLSLDTSTVGEPPGLDPWQVLACPLGPAQLLIDCALDASAPDGDLDCQVDGTSALVAAVSARRGALDVAGCRPAQAGGSASVDALVMDQVGVPWTGSDLAALLAARHAPLEQVVIASHLSLAGGAARHRIETAAITAGGEVYEEDLVQSLRPIIEVAGIPTSATGDGHLVLGRHAFTLRYGQLAATAFHALGLEPAGLGAREGQLGTALAAAVTAGADTGCAALSQLVCGAAGQAAGCLTTACSNARPALDDALEAWWQRLDAPSLDIALTVDALLVDDDLDLEAERIGGVGGEVAAELQRVDDEPAQLAGALVGAAPAP